MLSGSTQNFKRISVIRLKLSLITCYIHHDSNLDASSGWIYYPSIPIYWVGSITHLGDTFPSMRAVYFPTNKGGGLSLGIGLSLGLGNPKSCARYILTVTILINYTFDLPSIAGLNGRPE